MLTQSAKAKGRRAQQEIVATIKKAFPTLKDNDVQSVSMGTGGEDIVMSPLAESMFPYSVECKNVERLNVWKAIEQTQTNAPRGKLPILAIRRNRTKPSAVIPWDHFIELVLKSHQLHELVTNAIQTRAPEYPECPERLNQPVDTSNESPSRHKEEALNTTENCTKANSNTKRMRSDEGVFDQLRLHLAKANDIVQNL